MNKLFGLDWKSQFKNDNYVFIFFSLVMSNSAKICKVKMSQNAKKYVKMSQNAHYSTVFDII